MELVRDGRGGCADGLELQKCHTLNDTERTPGFAANLLISLRFSPHGQHERFPLRINRLPRHTNLLILNSFLLSQ